MRASILLLAALILSSCSFLAIADNTVSVVTNNTVNLKVKLFIEHSKECARKHSQLELNKDPYVINLKKKYDTLGNLNFSYPYYFYSYLDEHNEAYKKYYCIDPFGEKRKNICQGIENRIKYYNEFIESDLYKNVLVPYFEEYNKCLLEEYSPEEIKYYQDKSLRSYHSHF